MLLAELSIRHTRRNMRRGGSRSGRCTSRWRGPAPGRSCCGAGGAVRGRARRRPREALPRCLHDARDGLGVPRIALRHRSRPTSTPRPSRHRLVVGRGPASWPRSTSTSQRAPARGGGDGRRGAAARAPARAWPRSSSGLATRARFPTASTCASSTIRPTGGPCPSWLRGGAGRGRRPRRYVRGRGTAWRRGRAWRPSVAGHGGAGLRRRRATARAEVQQRFRRLVREAIPTRGGAGPAAMRLASWPTPAPSCRRGLSPGLPKPARLPPGPTRGVGSVVLAWRAEPPQRIGWGRAHGVA